MVTAGKIVEKMYAMYKYNTYIIYKKVSFIEIRLKNQSKKGPHCE